MTRARSDKFDRSDKADKREQIMQAAEQLFTSRGLHEITLDEVAQQAGVGKGTIYLYFKGKDDLFFQTATAGFDQMCELVRRKVPAGSDFVEQLLAACQEISAFVEKRRQLFSMMQVQENRVLFVRGSLHERWIEQRRKLTAAVGEIIRKGVEEGQVRADVEPDVLAALLLGMLRTRGRDLPETLGWVPPHPVIIDLFLRGASAPLALVGAARSNTHGQTRISQKLSPSSVLGAGVDIGRG